MKDKLNQIREAASDNEYVPTGTSTLKASVSLIPVVGGALDHLIFDKADEIRLRNIEQAIDEIGEKIDNINENDLSTAWFESNEAIELFRVLTEKVQFQNDPEKVRTLAQLYATSGLKCHADDPNKFAAMQKVHEITTIQKTLLQTTFSIPAEERKFSGNGLSSTDTAIWSDTIATKLNSSGLKVDRPIELRVELDILESLNLIRRRNTLLASVLGFEMTALGSLVCKYLEKTN